MDQPTRRFTLRRVGQIIAKSGDMELYRKWQESKDQVMKMFPELLTVVVSLDDATKKLQKTAEELRNAQKTSS